LNYQKWRAKIVFILKPKNKSSNFILICCRIMDFFAKRLIKWYNFNKRELPWRSTSDPYKIWLSEIILQQTQVNQGLSYYLKFIEHFPTVKDLAKAPEDKVMKLWQGLGYYSRARNLHEAAKTIVKEHNAGFPKSYNEIRALKGVGDYTAAAIASIAYGLPHAVVDGNVYRVLSRVFGIETPIDSTAGKKEFYELANELLPKKSAADFNQAIMEFGALYCRPQNPDCANCIFNDKCEAFRTQKVNQLPVKAKKTKVKDRYLNYIVFVDNGNTYINKREGKDIWKSLYEFYLIESDKRNNEATLLKSKELIKIWKGKAPGIINVSKEYKHILSHQNLHARFYQIALENSPHHLKLKKVKIAQLNKYAFPRLIEKYLKDEDLIK